MKIGKQYQFEETIGDFIGIYLFKFSILQVIYPMQSGPCLF